MWICEAHVGPEEFKCAAFELLLPIIGKLANQACLTSHDFLKVESNFARLNAPSLRVTAEMQDLSGIEQSLAGHAAAQNAKPADFLAAFDDHRFQTRACGSPRGRVAGAAAADHSDVKIKFALRLHGARMGDETVFEQGAKQTWSVHQGRIQRY